MRTDLGTRTGSAPLIALFSLATVMLASGCGASTEPAAPTSGPVTSGPVTSGPVSSSVAQFVIDQATIDLPGIGEATYDVVSVEGFAPAAAATARDWIDQVTADDLEAWRQARDSDCLDSDPCGSWTQVATVIDCIAPYACLLVDGGGVLPGAATSSAFVHALAIDPVTGEVPDLAQTINPATEQDLMAFLTEKVAAEQRAYGLACDDVMHVATEPLRPDSISAWLPTTDGIRVWFGKYAIGPGAMGVIAIDITWDELANADQYPDLGHDGCTATEVDDDGLPVLTRNGRLTAAGLLCPAGLSALPAVVPGAADPRYVRVIQLVLTSYGMYAGAYDGVYGKSTQKAVRQFQDSAGLTADAEVGPKTWKALQSSYCRNWG